MSSDASQTDLPSPQGPVDRVQREFELDELRSQQSLGGAVIAGAAGALVGAAVWAGVTVMTGFQIGWMAVAVGLLVGFLVRNLGRGIDQIFGVIGAAFSLIGCLFGNLFAVVGFVAHDEGIPFLDILFQLDPTVIAQLMAATFSPIDLLFYGIAVYEGYKLSFDSEAAPVADETPTATPPSSLP